MISAGRYKRLWEFVDAGILREMGLPTLVVSLVLFVSAMVLLGANISELREGYLRVQHSNLALLELEGVDNDILRIEMTVRGYVLSNDPIYLTWKEMSSSRLHDRVAGFDVLFGHDPGQRSRLKRLRRLLDEHCLYFDSLAKRAPAEHRQVVSEILDYGKKIGRRGIEDTLVEMRTAEMRELAEGQLQSENRAVQAYGYAIGMAAAALFLAGIGFALLVHDRRITRRNLQRA